MGTTLLNKKSWSVNDLRAFMAHTHTPPLALVCPDLITSNHGLDIRREGVFLLHDMKSAAELAWLLPPRSNSSSFGVSLYLVYCIVCVREKLSVRERKCVYQVQFFHSLQLFFSDEINHPTVLKNAAAARLRQNCTTTVCPQCNHAAHSARWIIKSQIKFKWAVYTTPPIDP